MAAARGNAPRAKAPAGPAPLPVVTTARFEQAMVLMERIHEENVDLFLAAAQKYRARARAASSRPLTALEAAQVAAAVIDDRPPEEVARAFQDGGLVAHDDPQAAEVLVAAGVATAPGFIRAAARLTVLMEMPAEAFEEAYDTDRIPQAVDQSAKLLAHVSLKEARGRASRALDHLAQAAGAGSGKGLGLLARSVWQAIQEATSHLSTLSPSPLSTVSAASTAASPDPTSSTG